MTEEPTATRRPPFRGPTSVRQALVYGLVALILVLVGGLAATFVAGGSDGDAPSTPGSGPLGLTPLGKGADLIGKPLPQAGLLTLDGQVTDLRALAGGRPVLLNFFSRTCVPCVKEMPAIERLYKSAGGKLRVVGVDVGDTADATRAFVASTGATYPIVRDPQSLVLNGYGVGSLPTTLAIGADGRIVGQAYGAFEHDDLARFVDRHLPPAG